MSTAFTTPTGRNFWLASVREEIRLGYSERRQALGGTAQHFPISLWLDGSTALSTAAKCIKSNFWSAPQQWIIDNCGSFVPPTYSSGDYDGDDVITTIHSLAVDAGQGDWEYFCKTICAGTSLVSGTEWGWRYKTISGGAILYPNSERICTDGDKVGTTHNAEDMIVALEHLIATTKSGDAEPNSGVSRGGNNEDADRATAISAARVDWAADSGISTASSPSASTVVTPPIGPQQYRAIISSNTSKLNVEGITLSSKIASIDWYVWATAPSGTYNAHGTGLQEDLYNYADSKTSGITDGTNLSVVYPSFSASAFNFSSSDNTSLRFRETGVKVVIIWDFTNA